MTTYTTALYCALHTYCVCGVYVQMSLHLQCVVQVVCAYIVSFQNSPTPCPSHGRLLKIFGIWKAQLIQYVIHIEDMTIIDANTCHWIRASMQFAEGWPHRELPVRIGWNSYCICCANNSPSPTSPPHPQPIHIHIFDCNHMLLKGACSLPKAGLIRLSHFTVSVPSHKGFITTIGQFHHSSCSAYKAPQDSHLDDNILASLNSLTIKMPFVMRILVVHANGAWTPGTSIQLAKCTFNFSLGPLLTHRSREDLCTWHNGTESLLG